MPRTTGSATPTTPVPGATTPRGSASSYSPTTKRTLQTWQKPTTERFPKARELDRTKVRGQARLPPHRRGGPTSTCNWLKRASSKPSSRRSTAWYGCFEPLSSGKPPRTANARASWASKPASASTSTSTSTTQTRPCERSKSSSPPRHCYGPCPLPQRPRRGTCTARRRRSSSKRPCSRPKARRPAFANRGARGTTRARKAPKRQYTRAARRSGPPTQGARQLGSGSLTCAGKPKTVTLATSSTPGGRATRRHGQQQATTPTGWAL
jgi:hypothetical protein